MKINRLQSNAAVSKLDNKPEGSAEAKTKPVNLLAPGDKFDATIVDIQRSQLKLLLGTGENLTAYSEVMPEARIGESTSFIVREHQNGKMLLEMLKSGENRLTSALAREALIAADMPVTDENIMLVKEMIAAKLPIDAANMQKSAFFYYSGGEKRTALDKVMFLVGEGFEASEKSLKTLDVLEQGLKIGKEMEQLGRELADIKPDSLKAGLKNEIQRLTHASRIALRHENTESVRMELERLYSSADEDVKRVIRQLSAEADNPAVQKVLERAERLSDSMDFIEQISRYRQYIQIPFAVNGRNADGDIYIFKDERSRTQSKGEHITALIALDYAALGRVEALAVKAGKSINLTFRAESEGVLKLINHYSGKLKDGLSGKGLTVTGFQLKRLDEPFKLTGAPIAEAVEAEPKKRYSFDMRV